MTADDDRPTSEQSLKVDIAVVQSKIDALTDTLKGLSVRFDDRSRENVLRTEWELRNQHVDTKFQNQGREISDLRAEVRSKDSRRPPWTAIAALVIAGAVLALDVIRDYSL